jgi:hypothetical protein
MSEEWKTAPNGTIAEVEYVAAEEAFEDDLSEAFSAMEQAQSKADRSNDEL